MTRNRILGLVLKVAVLLIVVGFVGHRIVSNWQEVKEADWRLEPLYLVGSFLLCSIWFWVRPLGWNIILNCFGGKVPFFAVYRVYRQSELSRYVPGAVWQFLSRIYLIKRWRVSASACLAATIVDLVLATLASLIPAAWTLLEAFGDFSLYHQILMAAFPLLSIAVVHPRILNAWAGFLAERLKQPWTPLEIGFPTLLGIWAMYVAGWLGVAGGLALFARGILELPPEGSAFIGSSYAVAWLVGTLTMIAPAGMGIRETALGVMLSRILLQGPAFTLAVAIRFWMLLIEVVWAVIGVVTPRPEPPEEEIV